jgi:hypothetical protein
MTDHRVIFPPPEIWARNHPEPEEHPMNEEANNPNPPRIIEADVPGDTVNVLPSSLWFAYEQRDGLESISVLCEDDNLGHFRIVLTPEDAAELARGLTRVSGPQLSQLRAVYAARQAQQ